MKNVPLHYFNTTDLQGSELQDSIRKAYAQDEKILLFFRLNPSAKLTKYEVLSHLLQSNLIDICTPETSIGRALNTLLKEKHIVKLNEFRIGKYGKRNHLWQLSEN